MPKDRQLVPLSQIEERIYLVRGQRVMLDSDLAELYGVETKNLLKAVKRNFERFPEDFIFQMTSEEFGRLRFQFGTSNVGRGGRRYLPYAFTEHGAIMAASVLRSERAVKVSVHVVRAFVKLRQIVASHRQLAQKMEELERRLDGHDTDIQALLGAIRELMAPPPEPPRKRIGFNQG
jgi:phage regulator Rha-like protein